MLQNNSILLVVDNSGAKTIKVIRCLGGSNRRYSRIGDLVVAAVQKADSNKFVKKEDRKVRALVVATRRYFRRHNDTWIKFSKNCAVLIKKKESKESKESKDPVGSRIFIPLLAEFDDWGYKKVLSLAPKIL